MPASKNSRMQHLLASDGTIAWAKVLVAREKSQSVDPGLTSMTVVSHMHVELRVEPEGESPFAAKFGQAFSITVPRADGLCKVVYDRRDRTRIAIIDGTCSPPGVSRDEAERRAAPYAPATPSTPRPSVADQLDKLADLKARGVLSDAEFAAQKAKLLERI